MPSAPPKACRCGALVPAGKACARCSRERERARPSRHQRGYGGDWSRLRAAHLAAHPACAVCGAPGDDVDHIRSIRERPDLRLDPANLQTLCRLHHNRKTHGKAAKGMGLQNLS